MPSPWPPSDGSRGWQAVRESGADLTILRSTWFMQNFSEDYMLEHVLSGEMRLPAGDVPTPFLDCDDIADVAVAALTEDGHVGQLYELTGPRSLTFAEVAAEISAAVGRVIRYVPVSLEKHAAAPARLHAPRRQPNSRRRALRPRRDLPRRCVTSSIARSKPLFRSSPASAKLAPCPRALRADWRRSLPPTWSAIHA